MEHTKDIVKCPDCDGEFTDVKALEKHGICVTCFRRQQIMKGKGIPYKKIKDLTTKELKQMEKSRKSSSIYKKKTKETTRRKVGDPVLNFLKENSYKYNIKELVVLLQQEFPNIECTENSIRSKLNREKLQFLKVKFKSTEQRSIDNLTEYTDTTTGTTITSPTYTSCPNEFNYLQPIYNEVNNVLDQKFKQLNCNIQHTYTTEQYIDTLKMLAYLCTNSMELMRKCYNQYDVTNAYQSDIVHESELVEPVPGNTYITDKLHILRNRRRKIKFNGEDISIMNNFFSSIDLNKLKSTLTELENISNKRKQLYFIPQVDTTMIQKYNWCTNSVTNTYKPTKKTNTEILKTNKIMSGRRINNNTNNRKMSKYKVSCELSGGGLGVFKPWTSEHFANSEEEAAKLCEKLLHIVNSKYIGFIHTDFRIIKIS